MDKAGSNFDPELEARVGRKYDPKPVTRGEGSFDPKPEARVGRKYEPKPMTRG